MIVFDFVRAPSTLLTLVLLLPAQAQDEAAAKKVDPEVPGLVQKLKEAVNDRKLEKEESGREAIDKLHVKLQAGLGDKDKQMMVKALADVFTGGKVREHDKIGLYMAATAALGSCGADGCKALRDAFENKQRFPDKPDWVPLRESLLKFMGKTKDESNVKWLLDRRQDKDPALQAAAGEALGNYDGSDQKVRKEIVEKMLITYGEIDSKANKLDSADIEAQNARDRRAVISDKWNTTLQKLTHQNFREFREWQAWHQNNKSKDWGK
jgi:hypothetical protein